MAMVSFETIFTASRMRMVAVWSDTEFGDFLIMLTATHFDI